MLSLRLSLKISKEVVMFKRIRQIFCLHSFEFEREKSWVLFEKMCSRLKQCTDVWFATNIEIKEYLTAVRGLICSANCRTIYNPSAKTVFLLADELVITVQPGETVTIP